MTLVILVHVDSYDEKMTMGDVLLPNMIIIDGDLKSTCKLLQSLDDNTTVFYSESVGLVVQGSEQAMTEAFDELIETQQQLLPRPAVVLSASVYLWPPRLQANRAKLQALAPWPMNRDVVPSNVDLPPSTPRYPSVRQWAARKREAIEFLRMLDESHISDMCEAATIDFIRNPSRYVVDYRCRLFQHNLVLAKSTAEAESWLPLEKPKEEHISEALTSTWRKNKPLIRSLRASVFQKPAPFLLGDGPEDVAKVQLIFNQLALVHQIRHAPLIRCYSICLPNRRDHMLDFSVTHRISLQLYPAPTTGAGLGNGTHGQKMCAAAHVALLRKAAGDAPGPFVILEDDVVPQNANVQLAHAVQQAIGDAFQTTADVLFLGRCWDICNESKPGPVSSLIIPAYPRCTHAYAIRGAGAALRLATALEERVSNKSVPSVDEAFAQIIRERFISALACEPQLIAQAGILDSTISTELGGGRPPVCAR